MAAESVVGNDSCSEREKKKNKKKERKATNRVIRYIHRFDLWRGRGQKKKKKRNELRINIRSHRSAIVVAKLHAKNT